MSYNGSGVFIVNSAGQPVVAATTITATAHNTLASDLATGLSTAICKDGQTTITGNIPFNGQKITGLGAGTALTDAASLITIQNGTGVYVGTVGGTTDVITLTVTPVITAYVAGQTFRFIASGANTTNVTVNVSALGAKAITKNGATALIAGDIPSGTMVHITYDGTRFILGTPDAAVLVNALSTVYGGITPADNVFRVVGSTDATKKVAVEVDSLTTATTRTRFAVDEDVSDGQSWEVKNLSLVATVGASALTVALKTKNGTDPSATDPIIVKFRHATIGTGSYTTVAVTAAMSLAVSSGSTLGTANGVARRLYLGVANDAGTLKLFIYNPLVSATLDLAGIQDDLLYTSVAEGGAGAADSAQIAYSSLLFTSCPVRLLGYLESTQATAGTWATTPSKIHILKPLDKRTGDLVQGARTSTGAVATGTTSLPPDDTIPQNTEGDQYLTKAITPRSAINLLRITAQAQLSQDAASSYETMALFQDATANALAAVSWLLNAAQPMPLQLRHTLSAGTVSATTFNIRAGKGAAGTTTFNGVAAGRLMGGVLNSYLDIEEVQV